MENDVITFPYRDPKKQNLRLAVEWAMNRRILGRTALARFDGGTGVMDCLVTSVADKLLEYCKEVRQIWQGKCSSSLLDNIVHSLHS